MATVDDPVTVINTIEPANQARFGIVDAEFIKGGIKVFADTDERDEHPFERLTVNTLCVVGDDASYAVYRCTDVGDDDTPATWETFDAPIDASAILASADPEVANGRVLAVTSGELTKVDGGAGTTMTLGLAAAGSAGTYAYPASMTTDAKGRVTSVTAAPAPAPKDATYVVMSTTSALDNERALLVTAGDLVATDAGAGASVTLGLATAGLGAASYSNPDAVTVDTKGRVTSVTAGVAKAPASSSYVVVAVDGTLTSERALAVTGADLTLTDGGAGASATLALAAAGLGAASYTYPSAMTVDAKGRVTSVSSASAPAPATGQFVTLATDATLSQERVLTGTAGEISITDGGAGAAVTLALVAAGTAGTYAYPSSVTTDAKGRITSITEGNGAPTITRVLQDTTNVDVYDICYLSDINEYAKAKSDGTAAQARAAGVCVLDGGAGSIILAGVAVVKFTLDGGEPAPGSECWLAAAADDTATGAGKATATPPTTGYLQLLGIVLDPAQYSTNQTVVVAFTRAPLAIA